jgi:hypothetical protein
LSGRAPYGPPLEKVAVCICDVFDMGEPLSFHKAAKNCGQYHGSVIDPRTMQGYITRDIAELNKRTNKMCGRQVAKKCVKDGLEISQSLDGALKDQGKRIAHPSSPEEPLESENEVVCLTDPDSSINDRVPVFRSFPLGQSNAGKGQFLNLPV